MKKTTLTFYLPEKTYKQAKIYAVNNGASFSDLAVRCVMKLIENNSLDLQKPGPQNDEKVLVYLEAGEKKKIKLYAAKKAVTVSELFRQALEQNKGTAENLSVKLGKKSDRTDHPGSSSKPAAKKNPFSYNLTPENDAKLRLLSVQTGKSRTQLILEAVEKAGREEICRSFYQDRKYARSSMNLSPKEKAFLQKRARELDMGTSELINRALALL